jgi:hypothetical protein
LGAAKIGAKLASLGIGFPLNLKVPRDWQQLLLVVELSYKVTERFPRLLRFCMFRVFEFFCRV